MKQQWTVMALLCAAMIAVYIVDLPLGGALTAFGVHPRDIGSAYTIFTSPFIHADFAHLANNLLAFAVLGMLCMLHGVRYFTKASLLIIVVGGTLLWLFGRGGSHIGASGWIFGLWSLAIAQAWFDRSPRNFAVALGVAIFYGGMIFGILPMQSGISFEGHLFGALAGVVAASVLARKAEVEIMPPVREGELKFWS